MMPFLFGFLVLAAIVNYWLGRMTRFVFTGSTISFLASDKKRKTIHLEKITGITEDAGAGMDETGNTFYQSYHISYQSDDHTLRQAIFHCYILHNKEWDAFIAYLLTKHPEIPVSIT